MGIYVGSHSGREGMLLINQIKLKPYYTYDDLKKKVSAHLKVFETEIKRLQILRISVDARRKPDIYWVLSVCCEVENESSVLRRLSDDKAVRYEPVEYHPVVRGTLKLKNRPIVVGAGPAGLFCAYYLAKAGFEPIILERGYDIDSRIRDVEEFWSTGNLSPNSNIQFGEGGAGAFSDGKLNTLINDKSGRSREVLKLFVECGADEDILTDSKPHIGTDVLVKVIKNLHEKIREFGGEFKFNAEVTDITVNDGILSGVTINGLIKQPADICILAIGHSARNTFEMLYDKGVKIEAKDFAVGLRVEHEQKLINDAMYGPDPDIQKVFPVASYKLTYKASSGRGVYSFCMCPGGYVVNASSEPGRTCVNGMSYKKRDGKHANSAIIVTVGKEDYGSDHPLAGMYFQRKLEEAAYAQGNGAIPVQFYNDFKTEVTTGLEFITDNEPDNILKICPECKGDYSYSHVSEILPQEINEALIEGMEYFGKIIPGFNDDTVILSGVESRTSSPVKMLRDDAFESESVKGLYPCGEGAGYAGGIMSAAMDGMKVFEAVIGRYCGIQTD